MAMIPDTFTLFSQQWTIRTAQQKELINDLGMCFPDSNEILLNANQSAESIKQTLLHELLHSIEMKQHLKMTERQIDCLSLGLIHLFSENPQMLDLLVYTEESLCQNQE